MFLFIFYPLGKNLSFCFSSKIAQIGSQTYNKSTLTENGSKLPVNVLPNMALMRHEYNIIWNNFLMENNKYHMTQSSLVYSCALRLSIYCSHLYGINFFFNCSIICGAQQVWKHMRMFFRWYYILQTFLFIANCSHFL